MQGILCVRFNQHKLGEDWARRICVTVVINQEATGSSLRLVRIKRDVNVFRVTLLMPAESGLIELDRPLKTGVCYLIDAGFDSAALSRRLVAQISYASLKRPASKSC